VATRCWQNAEGEKTAREAVVSWLERAQGQRRRKRETLKRSERQREDVPGIDILREPHNAKTSKISLKGEDQRGNGEAISPIAL
jgi:hypothetical protein